MSWREASRVVLLMEAGNYVGPLLAERLGRAGHRLFLHRPTDDLEAALQAAGVEYGVQPDVIDPDEVQTGAGARALISACLTRFGRLDAAYVRCARFVDGPFDAIDDATYQRVSGQLDVTFHCLRAVVDVMKDAGRGDVVVGTSAHGERPTPGHSVYAAMRAAENALVRSVAREYASRGLVINAVGTNFMKFPEYRGGWRAEHEEQRHETPRGQMGTMVELADLYEPLLLGRHPHLIGQVLSFDGGWY